MKFLATVTFLYVVGSSPAVVKGIGLTNCGFSANTIFDGLFSRCPSDTFVTGFQTNFNPTSRVTSQYCCDPDQGTITTSSCELTRGVQVGEDFCPTGKLPNNLCNTRLTPSFICNKAPVTEINLTCCNFFLDGKPVTATSNCRWIDAQVGDLMKCASNELAMGLKGSSQMSTDGAPVGTVGIYCCTYQVAT